MKNFLNSKTNCALLALLGGALLALPCLAADEPAAGAPAQSRPQLESVREGELRLDGKVTGLLGAGTWQMQAASWTSPRGVTTDFDEPKNKGVQVSDDVIVHPRGSGAKYDLSDIKLGSLIAVIGKNGPDGILTAREVILLGGVSSSQSIGTVSINAQASAFLRQARAARDGGQTAKALSFLNQALGAAQGAADATGQGLVLRDMGSLYSEMGQPDKSIDAYKRSIEISRGRNSEEASGYNGLGITYIHAGKTLEAVNALEKAVELMGESEPRAQAIYLDNLATAYSRAGKADDAYRTLQRLAPIQDNAGQRDDATETLAMLAVQTVSRSPENARDYLTKVLPRLPQVRDQKMRANLMTTVARAQWRLGDKDAAKAQFEAAAKQYEEVGDAKNAQSARELPKILEETEKALKTPEVPEGDDGPEDAITVPQVGQQA